MCECLCYFGWYMCLTVSDIWILGAQLVVFGKPQSMAFVALGVGFESSNISGLLFSSSCLGLKIGALSSQLACCHSSHCNSDEFLWILEL